MTKNIPFSDKPDEKLQNFFDQCDQGSITAVNIKVNTKKNY